MYIKAGKLTDQVLAKALQAAMRRMRDPNAKHGKQSVKSLTRRGASLQNIEITDSNIKDFERSALHCCAQGVHTSDQLFQEIRAFG